jgi:hypothetical protein
MRHVWNKYRRLSRFEPPFGRKNYHMKTLVGSLTLLTLLVGSVAHAMSCKDDNGTVVVSFDGDSASALLKNYKVNYKNITFTSSSEEEGNLSTSDVRFFQDDISSNEAYLFRFYKTPYDASGHNATIGLTDGPQGGSPLVWDGGNDYLKCN